MLCWVRHRDFCEKPILKVLAGSFSGQLYPTLPLSMNAGRWHFSLVLFD